MNNARLELKLINAGLLPLSLQYTPVGKPYRAPVPTNEERLQAFRQHIAPVAANSYAWPHTKASNEGELK